MSETLSLQAVRHLAHLARLRPDEEQLQSYQHQLSVVLDHFAKLEELDVQGIEPMAHPAPITNRLDEDIARPSLGIKELLKLAPVIHDDFLVVPKVIETGAESS